jgi:hypothetical protein
VVPLLLPAYGLGMIKMGSCLERFRPFRSAVSGNGRRQPGIRGVDAGMQPAMPFAGVAEMRDW